jgi:Lysophospholipase L1 and related esterases
MRARNTAALAVACALVLAMVMTLAVSKTSAPPPPVPAPSVAGRPPAHPTPAPTASAPKQPGTAENPLTYVALGDSFAAGQGGGDEQGACLRSPNGYPELLGENPGVRLVVNAACSGANTHALVRKQLGALDPSTDLVTLSIGGNDLKVAELPTMCARQTAMSCQAAVRTSILLLGTLSTKLDAVYQAVAAAAPNARILVTGYPSYYDVPKPSDPDFATIVAVDAAVIALNDAIKQAVAKQQRAGADIAYVDVSFAGHGVTSKHPWFVMTGLDALHPTAEGYRAYLSAVTTALRKAKLLSAP